VAQLNRSEIAIHLEGNRTAKAASLGHAKSPETA
jgi:hypothetical protein